MSNEIAAINEENKVTEQLLCEYLKTLTNKLTDNERTQFLAVAKAFNLNPFKREIYAVVYGQGDKRTFSIIVGYETYLKRAEEFPQYDGYDVEFGSSNGEMYAKCHVYRKDRSHSTTSTVWLSEYSTGRSLWASKPRVMLEKVAICTAFRRAFPSEYGGMPYAPEELSTSTEESLKAQGLTEVKADEQQAESIPAEDSKKAAFVGMMQKLEGDCKEVYDGVLSEKGIKSLDDVKEQDRKTLYKAVYNAIVAARQAEKTAETTETKEADATSDKGIHENNNQVTSEDFNV